MQQIRAEVLALSASERACLVHDLILSFDDPADYDLSPQQEAEIQRRVRMVKEGQATGRTAAAVLGDLEAQR